MSEHQLNTSITILLIVFCVGMVLIGALFIHEANRRYHRICRQEQAKRAGNPKWFEIE